MKSFQKLSFGTVLCLLLTIILSACGGEATPTAVITTTANITTTTAATTTIAPTAAVVTTTAAATTVIDPAIAPPPAKWVKDGVCYEVFVRSFYDSNGDGKGDLQGLISKLDYLNDGNPDSGKSLNVNCIWLMPTSPSPSYHGYDITDYYGINPDYGTMDDFKKLLLEAHKRGIFILIDLVLNHTSDQHPWFKQAAADPKSPYRDWYVFSPTDPGYAGPQGQKVWHKNPLGEGYYYGVFDAGLPDLNLKNPDVTKELYKITQFWLKDIGVDGFRMDAVKHFIEDGQKQIDTTQTKQWLRDYRKFYSSFAPEAFTIGEVSTGSTLTGYYPDELDEYFEFSLAQSLVLSAKNSQASFVNLVKDSNNKWPAQRYGTFLTNHDQPRVMDALSNSIPKMKLASTALLTVPGLPFIYYGEEVGMVGVKPDEKIRTPMQWTDAATGFTSGTPWEALNTDIKTANVKAQDADPASLLNLYRNLIKLRRTTPALSQGDYFPLSSSQFTVAAYLRKSGTSTVMVVLNMSDEAVTDLKLSADESSLAAGQYTATQLFSIDNSNATPAAITVKEGGAISDYSPKISLPGRSGYIFTLKK